ncbi:MAG TPA: PspC domain-containing protein [Baekduia sp.]|uniref:PspC domain-containing protein n=1 Tax=Baekduia sp. TaxID=2600305 RepID=UPI002B81024C|nr:PspC domain-containing protein [Baekduia sp.]HMJ34058.1 PspC domain-containing protein [Baekduia sp.]
MPETPDSPDAPEPQDRRPDDEAPTEQAPRTDVPPAGEAPTTAAPAAGPRRLLRSRDDRVIAGVCSGIARYFNIDPLIVRIAAVALAFVGGAGVIAYVAAYFLVPVDDGTGHPVDQGPSRLATVLGAIAIVLAGIALLDGSFGFGFAWTLAPFGFVVLILVLVGQRLLRRRGEDEPPVARLVKVTILLLGVLIGCALLFAGSAWATAAGGGTVVAALVVALGVTMVALSFRHGEARWLALPALVLAIPAGVVSAAGIDLDGGVGERNYTPATIADLKPGGYQLGAGELDVDLRRMQWPADAQVSLRLDVGTGHALVVVPSDVCVQAKTHAGLGYVDVLGDTFAGADVDDEAGTVARHQGRRLIIDGDVGIGAIEIRHRRPRDDWRGPGGDRAWHDDVDTITDLLADAGCAGARA